MAADDVDERSSRGGIVIAGKRLARTFGHWNEGQSPPRRDAGRPDESTRAPSPAAGLPPAGRATSPPEQGGGASRRQSDFVPPVPSDDTTARLRLLAQRREDGELRTELAELIEVEGPESESALMRNALRALADRWSRSATSPAVAPPDAGEALWNRVLGIAAPMLSRPEDRRAR